MTFTILSGGEVRKNVEKGRIAEREREREMFTFVILGLAVFPFRVSNPFDV